jgi:hypothetical protein
MVHVANVDKRNGRNPHVSKGASVGAIPQVNDESLVSMLELNTLN